jgi:transcriptional regulator with XRE-family HTH domain
VVSNLVRAVRQSGRRPVANQTDRPFIEELPRLLRERRMSVRALARTIGISDSHLSRVLRRTDYKTPSPDLTRRAALALRLPPDYFPEFREAYVMERLKSDPKLRNDLYARLTCERGGHPKSQRGSPQAGT